MAALILAACGAPGGEAAKTPLPGRVLVHMGEGAVEAEVASTAEARRTGLMHRRSVAPDAGMLFLFPRSTTSGFWMKDTLIPLSIAFIGGGPPGRYEVLEVLDMEPCAADPCPSYSPGVAYDLALETNQGWFSRHGVGRGTRLTIEGRLPEPS